MRSLPALDHETRELSPTWHMRSPLNATGYENVGQERTVCLYPPERRNIPWIRCQSFTTMFLVIEG